MRCEHVKNVADDTDLLYNDKLPSIVYPGREDEFEIAVCKVCKKVYIGVWELKLYLHSIINPLNKR